MQAGSTPQLWPRDIRGSFCVMHADIMTEEQHPETPWPWAALDDPALLAWRLRDLKVTLERAPVLHARVEQLYSELAAKGLCFRPVCYLSTEWLCPDRVPAIGIPFYLAHPRLIKLERTMMLEAEGEAEQACMQLLRHEAGHAINYAYRLYRRSRWRELFGPISRAYHPHAYPRRPYSRQYVVHLQDHYAQAHPDEDFAETFAVWLTPGMDWRHRYRARGALRKLEYVDHLMNEIGALAPPVTAGPGPWFGDVSRMRSTLERYYATKKREFARAYAGYYDPVLRRLFAEDNDPAHELAYRFLTRHRKAIAGEVARWARMPKYAADDLLRRLAQRAREMNLRLSRPPEETRLSVAVCVTALALEAREQYLRQITEDQNP
jgi:hypothetical protein